MKKIYLRAISLISAALLLILCFPFPAVVAWSTVEAGITDAKLSSGYSDSFFAGNAEELDWQLADVSLIMSLCAADKELAKDTYGSIGFTDITFNDTYDEKIADNIGLAAAKKDIELNGDHFTLVSMTVRGVNYEIEWADNFNVGIEGDHQGFSKNAGRAADFLSGYLKDIKGPVKLWIQGYSRGGAIAYMSAQRLLDSKVFEDKRSMFVYTFNAPNGVIAPKESANIHNIINTMDLVSMIPPESWGFRRHGKTVAIGDPGKAKEYASVTEGIDSGIYEGLDFKVRQIDAGTFFNTEEEDPGLAKEQYSVTEFLNKFMAFLQDKDFNDPVNKARSKDNLAPIYGLTDRETYVKNYQASFVYLFEYMYKNTDMRIDETESMQETENGTLNEDESAFASIFGEFLLEAYAEEQDYAYTVTDISELMGKNAKEGASLPDETHMRVLCKLFGRYLRQDSGAANVIMVSFSKLTMLPTFMQNAGFIMRGHVYDAILSIIRHDHPEERFEIDICKAGCDDAVLTGECIAVKGDEVIASVEYDNEDYIFDGWFDGDSKVSEEASYEFKADKDIKLTARFTKIVKEQAQEETVVTESQTETIEVTKTDEEKTSPVMWIAIAGAVLLTGGITAAVLIIRKKKS